MRQFLITHIQPNHYFIKFLEPGVIMKVVCYYGYSVLLRNCLPSMGATSNADADGALRRWGNPLYGRDPGGLTRACSRAKYPLDCSCRMARTMGASGGGGQMVYMG